MTAANAFAVVLALVSISLAIVGAGVMLSRIARALESIADSLRHR